MRPEHLMLLSAAIVGALGLVHLIWTFRGPRFQPREAQLRSEMERVSPVLTRQTTMWRAWIGFNASHSVGALVFGLIYGHLAISHAPLLYDSWYLLGVGALTLGGYLVLAVRYWFSAPRNGVMAALACYVASVVWALTT